MALTSEALESSAEAMEGMGREFRELSEKIAPVADLVPAIRTLADAVTELTTRFNQYVDSTAEQNGRLRSRLSTLELKLGVR